MSLLSTDIKKLKRLSLREVRLPAPERRVEPTISAERPPTQEEIAYSSLLAINPLLEDFVERLDLVSCTTGERIRKVVLPHPEPEPEPDEEPELKQIDRPKLIALAQRIIEGGNNYTQEEIVERMVEATNVSRERAERGFILLLQAGAIEATQGERYYLTGSTPF